jgi:hypothetical protein
MQRSLQFEPTGEFSHAHKDVVFTPEYIARAMVRHFAPSGKMLDPCKGDGVFLRQMPGADYCELQEGRDFFDWVAPVDWIISNPPYSVYSEWLRHSFLIAENIVYLIPINKAFNSSSMLKATYEFGGIAEIVHIGPGGSLKFPVGFAVGAVHYKRGYSGGIVYRHGGF